MTLPAELAEQLHHETEISESYLHVRLARTAEEIRAAQRLRYRVFVEEMRARIDCREPGVETDRFDPYCEHLLVLDSDNVVGCYRILTDTRAYEAGGYYSQTEFDLTRILPLPGRLIEIGRSCVHPSYRTGATIALLWKGLAEYITTNRVDYVIGSASIPLTTGTLRAQIIYERLARTHLAPALYRIFPKVPLPKVQLTGIEATPEVPALIKAYLRAGAQVCGEPAWDPVFNVADLFILLRTEAITRRYQRHFLRRA